MRIKFLAAAVIVAIALGMAWTFMSHEPAVVDPPPRGGGGQTAEPEGEEPERRLVRLAADPTGTGRIDPSDISRARLRSLLTKLSRTHIPSKRQTLIDNVRKNIGQYEPFILEILGDEDDKLILEAIGLAGRFRLEMAAMELSLLVRRIPVAEKIKAAAIVAKEQVEPWSTDELRDLLDLDSPSMLKATLDLCRTRPDQPMDKIIALLGHDDAEVRAAAIAAIPRLESGEDLQALCAFAKHARGTAAQTAAEALGRTALPPEAERGLYELLDRGNWMLVRAALKALGNKDSELNDAEPILAVLRDQGKSIGERFQGFIALEKTGTIPVQQIRDMLPGLHPVLRLFGARCLVTSGDRSGVAVLIELLDTTESDTVDDEEVMCAKKGARSVLTELAGQDLGEGSGSWERWYGVFRSLHPTKLQTSPPTFW